MNIFRVEVERNLEKDILARSSLEGSVFDFLMMRLGMQWASCILRTGTQRFVGLPHTPWDALLGPNAWKCSVEVLLHAEDVDEAQKLMDRALNKDGYGYDAGFRSVKVRERLNPLEDLAKS